MLPKHCKSRRFLSSVLQVSWWITEYTHLVDVRRQMVRLNTKSCTQAVTVHRTSAVTIFKIEIEIDFFLKLNRNDDFA